MSECIPFDIQEEILTRIADVKSLIRFRSVSKTWKSLIDSSRFITHHTHRKHHHHHICLSYTTRAFETHYVSILDNDSFPQHKLPLTRPPSFSHPCLIGTSSHGLFCFRNYGTYCFGNDGRDEVVIWNPSLRKSITVDFPNMLDLPYKSLIGFGVCPHTLHFKLVQVSYIYNVRVLEYISCIPCQVEVFTRGAWRSPLCTNNLPRKTIEFFSDKDQVVVDGFIYWRAFDRIPDDRSSDHYSRHALIISFDLTREEFAEIHLPNGLSSSSICKLKESLVMLEKRVSGELVFDVWKMEHGVSKTFSKLYTISVWGGFVHEGKKFSELYSISAWEGFVHGFRRSGEPIISIDDWDNQIRTLYVYEPDSRNIKDLEISLLSSVVCCSSYEETLLLLDY